MMGSYVLKCSVVILIVILSIVDGVFSVKEQLGTNEPEEKIINKSHEKSKSSSKVNVPSKRIKRGEQSRVVKTFSYSKNLNIHKRKNRGKSKEINKNIRVINKLNHHENVSQSQRRKFYKLTSNSKPQKSECDEYKSFKDKNNEKSKDSSPSENAGDSKEAETEDGRGVKSNSVVLDNSVLNRYFNEILNMDSFGDLPTTTAVRRSRRKLTNKKNNIHRNYSRRYITFGKRKKFTKKVGYTFTKNTPRHKFTQKLRSHRTRKPHTVKRYTRKTSKFRRNVKSVQKRNSNKNSRQKRFFRTPLYGKFTRKAYSLRLRSRRYTHLANLTRKSQSRKGSNRKGSHRYPKHRKTPATRKTRAKIRFKSRRKYITKRKYTFLSRGTYRFSKKHKVKNKQRTKTLWQRRKRTKEKISYTKTFSSRGTYRSRNGTRRMRNRTNGRQKWFIWNSIVSKKQWNQIYRRRNNVLNFSKWRRTFFSRKTGYTMRYFTRKSKRYLKERKCLSKGTRRQMDSRFTRKAYRLPVRTKLFYKKLKFTKSNLMKSWKLSDQRKTSTIKEEKRMLGYRNSGKTFPLIGEAVKREKRNVNEVSLRTLKSVKKKKRKNLKSTKIIVVKTKKRRRPVTYTRARFKYTRKRFSGKNVNEVSLRTLKSVKKRKRKNLKSNEIVVKTKKRRRPVTYTRARSKYTRKRFSGKKTGYTINKYTKGPYTRRPRILSKFRRNTFGYRYTKRKAAHFKTGFTRNKKTGFTLKYTYSRRKKFFPDSRKRCLMKRNQTEKKMKPTKNKRIEERLIYKIAINKTTKSKKQLKKQDILSQIPVSNRRKTLLKSINSEYINDMRITMKIPKEVHKLQAVKTNKEDESFEDFITNYSIHDYRELFNITKELSETENLFTDKINRQTSNGHSNNKYHRIHIDEKLTGRVKKNLSTKVVPKRIKRSLFDSDDTTDYPVQSYNQVFGTVSSIDSGTRPHVNSLNVESDLLARRRR